MAKKERDPRYDPKPGDKIVKLTGANTRISRTVVKRADNDITYLDRVGKQKTCWLGTWMDWAREGDIERAAK